MTPIGFKTTKILDKEKSSKVIYEVSCWCACIKADLAVSLSATLPEIWNKSFCYFYTEFDKIKFVFYE